MGTHSFLLEGSSLVMYSHQRAQSELVLIHHGFSPTTLLSCINHSMSIVERCVNLTNHVGSLLYASSPDVAGSCLESSNKQRKRKFIWINSLAPWRFWKCNAQTHLTYWYHAISRDIVFIRNGALWDIFGDAIWVLWSGTIAWLAQYH